MPSFPPQACEEMEAPITSKELDLVLASSTIDKALCLDGLTLSYYKNFWDILSHYFLQAYNPITADHDLPVDTLRAHITVIPKPNKDHM